MERQLITRVEPIYPSQAKSDHIQGSVRLELHVARDGTVQDAHLVSGPPQLVAAAIVAVRQWKYRPTVSAGHAVAVVTVVSVPFDLSAAEQ